MRGRGGGRGGRGEENISLSNVIPCPNIYIRQIANMCLSQILNIYLLPKLPATFNLLPALYILLAFGWDLDLDMHAFRAFYTPAFSLPPAAARSLCGQFLRKLPTTHASAAARIPATRALPPPLRALPAVPATTHRASYPVINFAEYHHTTTLPYLPASACLHFLPAHRTLHFFSSCPTGLFHR